MFFTIPYSVGLLWLENRLEPWKFVPDMRSAGHWGLIMLPGQAANKHKFRNVFSIVNKERYFKGTD